MRWIVVVTVTWVLSAWSLTAPAQQQSVWKAQLDAGCDACAKGDFATGEKDFRAAAREAEGFGADNPLLALTVDCLGRALMSESKLDDAEKQINRAYAMRKKAFKEDHPQIAMSLESVGMLKEARGKYADAEKPLRQAVDILEKAIKADDDVGSGLDAWNSLGGGLIGPESQAMMREQAREEKKHLKEQLDRTVGLLKQVLDEKANPPKKDAKAPAVDDPETKARGLINMAEQFAKNGMTDKAIEKLKEVAAKYPKTQAVADAQKRIEELQADKGDQGK